jgi:hypothetical protein
MDSDILQLVTDVRTLVAGQDAQLKAIQKELERLGQVAVSVEAVRADLQSWKVEQVKTESEQQRQIDSLFAKVERHNEIESSRTEFKQWVWPAVVTFAVGIPSWIAVFHAT